MPQMRTALAAQGFGAHHAERSIDLVVDCRFIQGLIETRPAATGIELGIGGKKRLIAAHAVVRAIPKMIGIPSGKRAFGRGTAGNLKRKGFGVAVGEPFLPFLLGFLNRV